MTTEVEYIIIYLKLSNTDARRLGNSSIVWSFKATDQAAVCEELLVRICWSTMETWEHLEMVPGYQPDWTAWQPSFSSESNVYREPIQPQMVSSLCSRYVVNDTLKQKDFVIPSVTFYWALLLNPLFVLLFAACRFLSCIVLNQYHALQMLVETKLKNKHPHISLARTDEL